MAIEYGSTLREIIGELATEVYRLEWHPSHRDPAGRRTAKKALTKLLLLKHQDVLTILGRIHACLDEHNQFAATIGTRLEEAGPGRIEDPGILADFQRRGALVQALTLDIKSLYVSCADIYEIYDKHGVKIDLCELRRIRLLRSKLITHIASSDVFRRSKEPYAGIKYDEAGTSFQILLHPLHTNRYTFRGLKGTVRAAVPYIPALAEMKGYREQISALYRNQNRLPRRLQRQTANIIAQAGVETEHPKVLGAALPDSLRAYRRLKRL